MLNPRTAPKLYRQDDIWHVRIYVPKSVGHLVGAKELHRTTNQSNRAAALKSAEKIRSDLYVWFNELHERATQKIRQVSDLAEAEIADMARKVYLTYREEIDVEMAELFRLPSNEHDAVMISEEERSPLLRSMLADFDLPDAADANARMMLKQRGLTLAPGNRPANYAEMCCGAAVKAAVRSPCSKIRVQMTGLRDLSDIRF